MNIFFTIGLVWVMLQCISNRCLYGKYLVESGKYKHVPAASFIGLFAEIGFIISLIIYVNQ
jgi:hypothetical protein